jgi:hypothetical protein
MSKSIVKKHKTLIAFLTLFVANILLATFFNLFADSVNHGPSATTFNKHKISDVSSRIHTLVKQNSIKSNQFKTGNLVAVPDSPHAENGTSASTKLSTEQLTSSLTDEERFALPSTLLNTLSS